MNRDQAAVEVLFVQFRQDLREPIRPIVECQDAIPGSICEWIQQRTVTQSDDNAQPTFQCLQQLVPTPIVGTRNKS